MGGSLVAAWAEYYAHSAVAPVVVLYLHIGSLIVGGGLAVSLDRATLARREALRTARREHVALLASAHGVVTGTLGVALASGLALVAADLDSYLASWVFWAKMLLLALLLGNGRLMSRSGRSIQRDLGNPEADWGRLQLAARSSIGLWLALTLAGVALRTVG